MTAKRNREYELNFYPLSEILPNRKVRNLGIDAALIESGMTK